MHHPIALCPKHGFFAVTDIHMASPQIEIIDCQVQCPTCLEWSEMLPGSYDASGERLKLLLDPSISDDALRRIQEIASRLQRDEITVAEARAEAEKISPEASRLFDFADWSGEAKAILLAGIIGAAAVLGAAKMTGSPTTHVHNHIHVEQVLKRTNDALRNSTSRSTIPIPTPRPKRD